MKTTLSHASALAILATVGVCLGLAPAAAHAQRASDQNIIEFADTPAVIAPLGLVLNLPVGCDAQWSTVPGGKTRAIVQPDDGTWVLSIYGSRSADLALSAREALDEILRQRQERSVVQFSDGQRRASLVPFDATLYQRPGEATGDQASGARAYLRANPAAPDLRSIATTGYTILRTSPGSFTVFEIECPPTEFDRVRPIYETIVAAARFQDPTEQDTERAASILAGKDFLHMISADDLEQVLPDEPVFLRLFDPASTGSPLDEREVGYQRQEIRLGQLGELDPDKPRNAWNVADREWGFLVRVDARTLHSDAVFDSQAGFFLSRDRQNETWSIVMERKAQGRVARSRQTLVRRGTRLTVNTTVPGQPPVTAEYDLLEGHYLSGVERYLMPRLIAYKTPLGQRAFYDLSFYTYDPARGRVTLRRDEWQALDSGRWQCDTTLAEEQASWMSLYDEQGTLLQRQLNPTRVLEPTTRDRLRRIWADKDLPID